MSASEGTPTERICAVCNSAQGKYKCGKCMTPFCSVPCSQAHRNTPGACNPPPPPSPPQTSSPSPPPSRKPNHPFSALESSPELATLFSRYPNLPTLLLEIDAAMRPPTLEEQVKAQAAYALAQVEARQAPPSHRFRSRGGGGKKGRGGSSFSQQNRMPKRPEPWTSDIGIRKGKAALRKAINLEGEDGEAVRAYHALVLKLVDKNADAGDGASNGAGGGKDQGEEEEQDVARLLRQRLDEDDARLIEGLLKAERDMDG